MPEVGHVQQSRLDYYDRSPVVRLQTYSAANVAPHGLTTRWTYTVPSGKKGWLEALVSSIRVVTVAAPKAIVFTDATFTPSGGSGDIVFKLWSNRNTADEGDSVHVTQAGLLLAGDDVSGRSQDASTGGLRDYNLMAKLQEFDA